MVRGGTLAASGAVGTRRAGTEIPVTIDQMNLASIMLQPARDLGMVMMTNVAGPTADQALRALAEEL